MNPVVNSPNLTLDAFLGATPFPDAQMEQVVQMFELTKLSGKSQLLNENKKELKKKPPEYAKITSFADTRVVRTYWVTNQKAGCKKSESTQKGPREKIQDGHCSEKPLPTNNSQGPTTETGKKITRGLSQMNAAYTQLKGPNTQKQRKDYEMKLTHFENSIRQEQLQQGDVGQEIKIKEKRGLFR
ncbi:hypothetical protein JTE90_001076 [Oedothorax gibbosus]|uniref:Uncharacterized protein n=1 Tax=Oedothorax gibbosus TaxID=931172 RepID=A0AAV6TMQ9_9ARAC|nr:hypothetical protein JTE90_001076 [Oedothorax gibbosus]